MIIRSILSILILFVISSCQKDSAEVDPCANGCTQGCADNAVVSQTTLHYFMGTDLYSYYLSNISDIEAAVADGALGCSGKMFYLLPTSSSEAELYEVSYAGNGEAKSELLKCYEDFQSLSQEGFARVIEDFDLIARRPVGDSAHTKNLIIGSHGMAWELVSPSSSSSSMERAAQYNFDYGDTGHPGVANQPIPTRYMGLPSKASEGAMDIADIAAAIESSGVKFGYIIFDACFMSSIEVYYRLRNYADYIVASPAEVMAKGFPFSTIIPQLFTNSGESYNLQGVCTAFYNFYSSYVHPYGTIAMCVTSELEALAEVVSEMSFRAITNSERGDIQSYERYTSHKFYDLEQYISLIGDDDEEAVAKFQSQFDRAFPESYRLHTPTFYSGVSGTGSYERDITYYSGVTTSELSLNGSCIGWSLEPWAVDAGRAD